MGTCGHIRDGKEYFPAFDSIESILEEISNNNNINDVFLINIKSIPKFLEIISQDNIFKTIKNRTLNRKNYIIRNFKKKIQNALAKYKREENIEVIDFIKEIKAKKDDSNDNLNELKEKEFIIVNEKFLENMEIDIKANESKKISIKIVDGQLQIPFKYGNEEDEEYEEKEIIVLKEVRTGIFKIEEVKPDPANADVNSVYNEIQNKSDKDNDPEAYNDFRKQPLEENNSENNMINIIHQENSGEELQKNKKDDENENNEKNIEINNNDIIKINRLSKEEKDKALFAKFDEIVKLTYLSLQDSKEQNKIIAEVIKKYMSDSDINSEINKKEGIKIVENIEKTVVFLLQKLNNDGNFKNNDISLKSYNNQNRPKEQDLLNINDNDNEKKSLISSSNNEMNSINKICINPFMFTLMKIFNCDKCGIKNEEIPKEYYTLILNEGWNNLDECFKIELQGKCEQCQNNIKYNYKFNTTPEILILIFDNPQENKKYIKLNIIEENINLQSHMYIPNKFNINYKLIKVLYILNDLNEINDNNVYIDIPEKEKNNYIPYIIFYHKINDI